METAFRLARIETECEDLEHRINEWHATSSRQGPSPGIIAGALAALLKLLQKLCCHKWTSGPGACHEKEHNRNGLKSARFAENLCPNQHHYPRQVAEQCRGPVKDGKYKPEVKTKDPIQSDGRCRSRIATPRPESFSFEDQAEQLVEPLQRRASSVSHTPKQAFNVPRLVIPSRVEENLPRCEEFFVHIDKFLQELKSVWNEVKDVEQRIGCSTSSHVSAELGPSNVISPQREVCQAHKLEAALKELCAAKAKHKCGPKDTPLMRRLLHCRSAR